MRFCPKGHFIGFARFELNSAGGQRVENYAGPVAARKLDSCTAAMSRAGIGDPPNIVAPVVEADRPTVGDCRHAWSWRFKAAVGENVGRGPCDRLLQLGARSCRIGQGQRDHKAGGPIPKLLVD